MRAKPLSLSIASDLATTPGLGPPAIIGSPRLKLAPLSLTGKVAERQAAGIESVLAPAPVAAQQTGRQRRQPGTERRPDSFVSRSSTR